jgi:hypothetical protein
VNNAFAAKNVRGFAEIITDVCLLPDPIKVTPNTGGEIDLRLVARGANPRCVAR